MKSYENISEYIASCPVAVRGTLRELWSVVKKAAPRAEEAIRYGMPTLRQNGNLVHFAAFKHHIGFFPTSSAVREFSKELKRFETSKGTIRFPLNKRLPFALIRKIVRYRVRQQSAKNA